MVLKYIVCFSGGHSSALVAIEAVRKVGKENVILLNHDLSSEVEDKDIKRFKQEVADYLGIELTYANMEGFEELTPLRVCKKLGGFKFGNGPILCTYKLKTEPFHKWLDNNYPVEKGMIREDITLLYGFDKNEPTRITRRVGIMLANGYKTDYPLANWERTIESTEEIGIQKPMAYEMFRHANCKGCLKAGKQQWYIVYCLYPELWKEAVETEEYIGYSLIKGEFLKDLEPKFATMKCKGIVPTEKVNAARFWADVNKEIPMVGQMSLMPCDCMI